MKGNLYGRANHHLSNDIEQKTKEVADLQEILKQKDAKLTEAQKTQADLLKQKRELDDAKRELDLTVEKRIAEGLTATRQQARKEAEDELKLKVSEKEQTISSMQKQIEDLKRRAEQGSQQLQGEVQELELETLLKAKLAFINGHGYRIGQIGSFVRISIGFTDLFGIVSQVGAGAVPEALIQTEP